MVDELLCIGWIDSRTRRLDEDRTLPGHSMRTRVRKGTSTHSTRRRKKIILLWIKTAKRDETRARRIAETVRLAEENIKAAHPEAQGR